MNTHAQAKVGRGRENMAWPNLPGFRGPLQDLVMTNQIADPAWLTLGVFHENLKHADCSVKVAAACMYTGTKY